MVGVSKVSRLMVSSDLHLGHKSIVRFRQSFASAEEHHNIVFDRLASNLNKRDTLYLLGDVAFDSFWLNKVGGIKCKHKVLILGNHDTDRRISIQELSLHFDKIHGLLSKNNLWFSHCPIHPQEMRNRDFCVHGHLHNTLVRDEWGNINPRYRNVCVEHTDYKPVTVESVIKEAPYLTYGTYI